MNLGAIGKYLFMVPMLVFGLFHFMGANDMKGMVPSWLPGGIFWVYLTGLALVLSFMAFVMNKKAKLAMTLLGLMLLVFVFFIHLPGLMGGNEMSMPMILKDTALAGAAFMLSGMMKE
ncbi:MAG: DoxX family protein [Cyclobacteriaceae bacterium]